ncbi:MAG: hypothetical protein IKG92_02320 [Bacteroidales bacterium]|jgi:hypothetical protein|nr:hypothetical protein [Bacteroidales bacterium]
MKVLKAMAIMAALTAFAVSCDDKPIAPEQLPAAAQAYLQENYPGSRILIAKKDYEFLRYTYDVKLDNGLEFSFNKNGLLVDVDD